MVGMDFNLFCFVETVKTFEAKSETDRYGPESIGFHSNTEEAREYLKKVVRGFYKREYQHQLRLKESRVKAAKLQGFLLSFRTMPFEEFVIQLQENVPNQTSMGITELLELVADDVKSMVDPVSKVELLLTGRFEESTWNNGSVARESSGLLLKLLEQIVPPERFAIIKEHVRRFSWHRYRGADVPGSDQTNRHGYGNLRPSFWAATGHSDPWTFLRKDPDGYKMFVDTLPTLETGTEGERVVFQDWSHLLIRQPTKEDRSAGKIRVIS